VSPCAPCDTSAKAGPVAGPGRRPASISLQQDASTDLSAGRLNFYFPVLPEIYVRKRSEVSLARALASQR
jgi:hypothetical protein